MSHTTKNEGSSQQAVPQVTTFQFSNDAVGQIKDSVNLFTGTANLPINIASLTGRKDLDVNIGIMYTSNVKNAGSKWNLTNPTSIVGMGWDMSFDRIVVNKNGSGTASSDEFYLLNNGSGNQLIQDGYISASPVNLLTFQLRNFEFWSIQYDSSSEKWTVIKEDGTVFIYGDKNSGRNTLQYGVGWGNWLGDSAEITGQQQYVTGWNLSEVQNVWGEKIVYSYDNTQVKTGTSTGQEYTQASYLKQITDSFDRTVTFNYKEKYGPNNPGPNNILEYQPQNTEQPSPNAYQEQYETRYLDSIDVKNADAGLMFTILFEYDFINLGITNQTGVYPLMWKRVLTSFWQVQPNGKSLPGIEFDYYNSSTDVNAGALKSVLYPQGAKATYAYKQQPLATSRNIALKSPLQGATPRVWFGSDYTVVTWYNAAQKKLKAIVYSWCGNWTNYELNSDQPTTHYFDNVDFDIDTLGVITRQDFIALYFTDRTNSQLQLFLYRRSDENFGVFNLTQGVQNMPLKSSTSRVSVDAGKDFVIAFSKDFTNNPVKAFQWNWKQKTWNVTPGGSGSGFIPVLLPSPSDIAKADNIVIAARDNYYITALYTQNSSLLQLQMFYHDGNTVWSKSVLYNTSNVKIYKDTNNPDEFPFSISLSNSFAVLTYVTAIDSASETISYSLRNLQWDTNFNILNASTPLVNNYTSPIVDNKSQFSLFNTILTNALVSNNPFLNRYIGGPGNSNNPLNWKKTAFTTQSSDTINFTTGQDITIMSDTQGSVISNKYYSFNPNNGSWGAVNNLASSGSNPTIYGNYITAGKDIFYKNTQGNWIKQNQQLNNLQAWQTVQNRGDMYIAYQDTTDSNAQTYFMSPANGIPGNPAKLPVTTAGAGQKLMVEQDTVKAGTLLAGTDSFVTYPSNEDFNTSSSLTLYRVTDGQCTGAVQVTPVAYIEIDNAYDTPNSYYQSYDYASSSDCVITYNAQNNLAQFPKITVVTGSKIPEASKAPAGITINYFSNGVSLQNEVHYPNNWVYNYNQLLNGTLLQKMQYNKDGKLVAAETNYWQIFKNNVIQSNYLFGAFFRLNRSVTVKDGVSKSTSLTYFQDNGLQQFGTTSYSDSAGEAKTVVNEKKYAIQVDSYKSAMAQKHLLNALAQESTAVTGKDGIKKYISSDVTTWKNWSNDGSWKWASFQNYKWLGTTGNEPVFDFAQSNPLGWLKKQEVITRGLPYNVITEMKNVEGVSSSYIYDVKGRFKIAEFLTASQQDDEISYYSFESYEDTDGWQVNANASVIPNTDYPTIDAQIGTSSLKINTGTGIQKQFTPKNQEQLYVFSSYVKLPEGFDASKGSANWVLSFSQNNAPVGNDIVLPFGTATDVWQYVYTIVNLKDTSKDPVTVTISAKNDNITSVVLIDCLRFSPLQSVFSAVSINREITIADATLGANGEVKRKFFDDFQRVTAITGFSDETTSLATSYFSRTGNDNSFSITNPNTKLRVMSAGGGPALSFTRGNEWMHYWQPGANDTWQTDGGELLLKTFTDSASLSYKNSMTNNYGICVTVKPEEALTQALGLKIGSMFTVQWDPVNGQWQLTDTTGKLLASKNVGSFSVDAGQQDNSTLVRSLIPKLLRRGIRISTKTENLTIDKNGIYDPFYRQYLSLKTEASLLTANSMGNQWLLLVNENSLLFFVEGELIFNYVSATPVTGTASLFAGNQIALNNLFTSFNNQITLTCINETGNDKQSQVLENTQMTIVENVYDATGKIIVNTKPAFVTPDQSPIFEYCKNFAIYNGDTLSGLVSDFYPQDNGYPFFGTCYEASPLGRVVEQSMPGTEYKLGANTQKVDYLANDGNFGLPAGEYFQTIVTDQNGNTVTSITDKRNLEVRKLSQKNSSEKIMSAVYYDDSGNPVELRSPNYKEGDANAENWVTYNNYNFIGQLISSTSNTMGTVNMIYDTAGALRFRMDAEAQAQGNYQYYKYDAAGRIIESGYITGAWDRDALQDKADNYPAYPATPGTWRLQTFYDYNGTTQPYQIGQVVKTLSNHSDKGEADIEENFEYTIFGNVKARKQKITPFSNDDYVTAFNYNNLSGITQIDYPMPAAATPLSIYYNYNLIGQITGIANQKDKTDNLAAYTYNPAGKPVQEILNKYNDNPVKRTYAYNSPVWLQEIQDTNNNTTALFGETLKTSVQNGPAYYNGQSAEIAFKYSDDININSVYTNWYNGLNALEKTDETSNGATVNRQYNFDSNGNFDTISIGSKSYAYVNEANKGDRLLSVTDKSDNTPLFNFIYNQNGAVSNYKAVVETNQPAQNLDFTYDAGSRMTTVVKNNINSNLYSLYYNSSNDRVLKQEITGTTVTSSSLYLKNLSGNTLVQVVDKGGVSQTTSIVYGPLGIISFTKDDQYYNVLKDHLGSVRVILDKDTNVAAAYNYDLYGNLIVLKEPAPNFFPYLYTSQEYDAELGIYNYKARFYFSRVGRFGVTDNYNQFYSPYIYAGNSPVVYIDPSGNFSIGNFFSAIAGAIVGLFEIIVGVVIDAIAAIVEVFSFGAATPLSIGLTALGGAFIGSGVSAVSYSAVGLITNDFSWKDYGINTAVGFVAGAITAGFGAAGAAAAEAATGVQAAERAGQTVSTLAKVANAGIEGAITVAGAEVAAVTSSMITNAANGESLSTGLGESLVTGVLSSSLSWAIPNVKYQAGWGNLAKRMAAGVVKTEAIEVTLKVGSNAVNGNNLSDGLLNTAVSGVVGGSIGSLGTKEYIKE